MAINQRNPIDGDLHRLEVGIRQLKTQYDMFFAGALAREPVELRRNLQTIIDKYSKKPIHKYAIRFRFNGLVARFTAYAELWGKGVRKHEEGNQRAPSVVERFGIREHLITRCRLSNPTQEEDAVRELHRKFVEANRRQNENAKTPSLEKFASAVEDQTRRLRKKSGCAEIELRVVVRDDKVQIKARPGR